MVARSKLLTTAALMVTLIGSAGCAGKVAPMETEEGIIPSQVFDYRSNQPISDVPDQMTAEERAVYQAGVRTGATSGYKKEVDRLYGEINQFGEHLDQTFSFTNLVLPEGLLPPVIVLTERLVTYRQNERQMSARVFRTTQDAMLIERNPSWRDYLNLDAPEPEHPSHRLNTLIELHPDLWRTGVRDGWIEGVRTGRAAMDVAIHELQRDYMGMQLFRLLWLSGMIEPPQVITATDHVQGGGTRSREMQVGVKRTVITQPAYLVPDTDQWRALSMEAWQEMPALGLSDLVDLHAPSAPLIP